MPGIKRAQVYLSSDVSSSEPEDDPPAKRVTAATRPSHFKQHPVRKKHATQDDNDESQTANQTEEKLKNAKAKLVASKAREKAFKLLMKQVHKDQDELRAQVHELAGDLDNTTELRQKMKQLVQDIVPELNPDVLELKDHLALSGAENMSPAQRKLFDKLNARPSFHSLQKSAGEVLSASNNLLATYQELNQHPSQRLNDETKRLRVQWEQDSVETERLLGVGKQVAQDRLDEMMPKSVSLTSTSSATAQPSGSDEEVHPIDRQLQQTFIRTMRGVYHITRDLPKQ